MSSPFFHKITASFMLLLVFTLMPISFCRGDCPKTAIKATCHQEEGVSKAVAAWLGQYSDGIDYHTPPAQ